MPAIKPLTYRATFEYVFPSGQTVLVEARGLETVPYRLDTLWLKFMDLDHTVLDVIYDREVFWRLERYAWDQLYLVKYGGSEEETEEG